MMEDLLTLLPTPIMLPPMIVGVSPEGIAEGLDNASLWSAPTGFPVVGGGFPPEDDPPGCVPDLPRCPPLLGWPIPLVCPHCPGCAGLPGPFNAFAGVPNQPRWSHQSVCRAL